jgi:Na+-transporting NADH:ubiquinone oxidoreductase subunit NqrE
MQMMKMRVSCFFVISKLFALLNMFLASLNNRFLHMQNLLPIYVCSCMITTAINFRYGQGYSIQYFMVNGFSSSSRSTHTLRFRGPA